jgi:hypothetical protein
MNIDVQNPSAEVVQSLYNHIISRHLNRKIDIVLLPFLPLLYLLNGLDRPNVGNAETQGLYGLSQTRHKLITHSTFRL